MIEAVREKCEASKPECCRRGKMPEVTLDILVERLRGRGITVIKYSGRTAKPGRFKCDLDGYEWETSAASIIAGSGCPKCVGNRRQSEADAKAALKNRPIELIGYGGTATKVSLFMCTVTGCGHRWEARLQKIRCGGGCPKCAGTLRVTEPEVFKRLAGRPVELLTYGGNNRVLSRFRCLVAGCSHEWSANTANVLNGRKGCPKCAGKMAIPESEISQRLEGRQIELLSYAGVIRKEAKFKCLRDGCGHEWSALAYSVVNMKRGCPVCSKTGFDPSEAGYLYAYRIQARHDEYLGFGITNDVKDRNGRHRRAFKKHGVTGDLLFSCKAAGVAVQMLERRLKDTLPIFDTGIDGFRTEAILWDQVEVDKLQRVARLLSEQFPQNPTN